MIRHVIRPALSIMVVMTILTGVIYPLAITGVAQLLFREQANGSLIRDGDKLLGSALVGQPCAHPKRFWSRPSATGPFPYNAAASSGSNLGPIEPNLTAAIADRAGALRRADPGNKRPIPVDLVTASASGLDPHISPAAADYQVARVAAHRGLDENEVRGLVEQHTQRRQLSILGEPRVNVLELNLALDRLKPHAHR